MQEYRAPVVDLALARSRRGAGETLLLRVSAMKGDEEAYRYVGVDGAGPLGDVARVIAVAFALPSHPVTPAGFCAPSGAVPQDRQLSQVFSGEQTTIFYTWGLWRFTIELAQRYPRDNSTPPAVCVAGSGDFGREPFRIAEVNRALLGDDMANDVLRHSHPEVRELVARSHMYDFVLLLKALGADHAPEVGEPERARIRQLPRERTRAGRDAFWTVALALACLADDETTDTIISTTYASLGYEGVPAAEVRRRCAGSLVRLASLGAYGAAEDAPADRLDIFRELLRG